MRFLAEFTFATLIQRTLGSPFDVRMHYGHPDIFDRLFHVTRGGISKANKVRRRKKKGKNGLVFSVSLSMVAPSLSCQILYRNLH
jgi:hypothetical protein